MAACSHLRFHPGSSHRCFSSSEHTAWALVIIQPHEAQALWVALVIWAPALSVHGGCLICIWGVRTPAREGLVSSFLCAWDFRAQGCLGQRPSGSLSGPEPGFACILNEDFSNCQANVREMGPFGSEREIPSLGLRRGPCFLPATRWLPPALLSYL